MWVSLSVAEKIQESYTNHPKASIQTSAWLIAPICPRLFSKSSKEGTLCHYTGFKEVAKTITHLDPVPVGPGAASGDWRPWEKLGTRPAKAVSSGPKFARRAPACPGSRCSPGRGARGRRGPGARAREEGALGNTRKGGDSRCQ